MSDGLFKNIHIETKHLILRSFENEDTEEFYEIIRDPEIYKTLPEDHMYSEDEVKGIISFFISCYSRNKINNIPKFPLAVVLKSKNAIIGDVGIGHYGLDNSITEIFYFINSNYWNKGYASEAVSAFLGYVRENKLINDLIGTVVPTNAASIRILEKNGFERIEHSYDDARIFYRLQFQSS